MELSEAKIDEVRGMVHYGAFSNQNYDRYGKKFREEAFEILGLTNHPKADKLWEIAWEEGHPYGLYAVLDYIVDLATLLE